jgi:hypothetical protein
MQPAAQVKPLSRRRCLPCSGHAMPCHGPAMQWPCEHQHTGLAQVAWRTVQVVRFSAVYGMHAVRSRLHAARMHATCSVQHNMQHGCMHAGGPDLRSEHQQLCRAPSPSPSPATCRVHAGLRAACSRLERATRARGVPQPFLASKGSALAVGAGEGNDKAPKGPSVLCCRASFRLRREEPQRQMPLAGGREDGRGGGGRRITRGSPGARLPPVCRSALFHR